MVNNLIFLTEQCTGCVLYVLVWVFRNSKLLQNSAHVKIGSGFAPVGGVDISGEVQSLGVTQNIPDPWTTRAPVKEQVK